MSSLNTITSTLLVLSTMIIMHVTASPVPVPVPDAFAIPEHKMAELRQTHRIHQVPSGRGPKMKDQALLARREAAFEKQKRPCIFDNKDGTCGWTGINDTSWAWNNPILFELQYHVQINVGDLQFMDVNFDTGLDTSWLFSKLLPKHPYDKYMPEHIKYGLEGKKGYPFNFTYVDGRQVGGTTYTDKMTLAGLVSPKQEFIAVSEISKSFKLEPLDGVLGMSFDRLRDSGPNTFLNNIRPWLMYDLFAAVFRTFKPGHFDFGFIDKQQYDGDIMWTPVKHSTNATKGLWAFEPVAYKIGPLLDTTLGVTDSFEPVNKEPWPINKKHLPKHQRPTVIDTGVSYTYLPREIVEKYYALMAPGAVETGHGWEYSCLQEPPDLNLWLDDWTILQIRGQNFYGLPYNTDLQAHQCIGGIMPNDDLPYNIIGVQALREIYTVFNYDYAHGGPSLGFAYLDPINWHVPVPPKPPKGPH